MAAKKFTDKQPTLTPDQEENSVRVGWLFDQMGRYDDYWKPETERMFRNGRMLWGVDFGQWPVEAVVQKLINEGRRPPTHNIVMDKAETIIGSILGNLPDVEFKPSNGKFDSLALKFQDIYLDDKNNPLLRWTISLIETLLYAQVMVGFRRMVISDAHHHMGNIAWETVNPLYLRLDPAWRTQESGKLNNYFTYSPMTATEIMNSSPEHISDHLKQLYEKEKRDGIDYGQFNSFVHWDNAEQKWQGRHNVIEFHYVTRKEMWWEYDSKNNIAFPESGFPNGSREDREAKIAYIQMMGLQAEDITWVKRKLITKYIQRVVPSLDRTLFLANGKDKVQTQNCNLYAYGSKFENQWLSLTDKLYDLQIGINNDSLNFDDIMKLSAKGAVGLDSALAGGDPKKKDEIERAWNDPGARIWFDEGTTEGLPNGGIIAFPHNPVTSDQFRISDMRYVRADQFSKSPAAFDARTQGSNEPALLFQNKIEVGMMGQRFQSEFFKQNLLDESAAYLRQAKITYAGYPRQFQGKGGKGPFWINQPVTDAMGNRSTVDDISKLPEMSISVLPSKTAVNMRTQVRSQSGEMLGIVSKDSANRLLGLTYIDMINETIELDDEKKAEQARAINLLKTDAALQIVLRITQTRQAIEATRLQAQGMLPQPQPTAETVTPENQNQAELATAGTPQQ